MKKGITLCLLLSMEACMGQKESNGPQGYDFNQREKTLMPESLLEISGIAFDTKDQLYAIQDEEGKLFLVTLKDGSTTSSKFGKKGDYEDVAIVGDNVIILRSDGALLSFPLAEIGNSKDNAKEWETLVPKGEYEGLFATADKKVYVLCKQCEADKGSKHTSGYVLDISPKGNLKLSGEFKIHTKEIRELAQKEKLHFHPSALTQHTETKDWYILSSVSKLLVVTDSDWKVKEVCPLDPTLFLQPEGIAFDSQHNLYISNEGDPISNGNVLKFSPKAK